VTVFADSSALVKLYADETGSEQMRALGALFAAQLARVEVVSAFWAKERAGALPPEDAQLLTSAFEADWSGTVSEPGRFAVVAITAELLDEAARLCARHGLRAYDAIQLASAVAARNVNSECDLAVYDQELRRAAAAEGFSLLPPALPV
jgi:predicted nucleic acid-binding protein